MASNAYHAIAVTSFSIDAVNAAHAKARELFGACGTVVSPIVSDMYSSVRSFFIAPFAGRDSFSTNSKYDECRAAFIRWLDTQRYTDGSGPLSWAEVRYGEADAAVTAHDQEESRKHLHGELR